jgi:hypothetical protein
MSLKAGRYVNAQDGNVSNVAYLMRWDRLTSQLDNLCLCLGTAFGEEPPVFKKPATSVGVPSLAVTIYICSNIFMIIKLD